MKGRDWWLLLAIITVLLLVIYGLSTVMTGCMGRVVDLIHQE